jgi:hypothetical protein
MGYIQFLNTGEIMTLDIIAEVTKLKEMYKSKGSGTKFNAIVYGDKGSGKSTLFKTARKPVFIDSFDPGGTTVLRDEIEKGTIIVDNRWESDDPVHPTMFAAWDKEFHRRKRDGFFDVFATYGVDSFTTLSIAAMNEVLRKRGRAGGVPSTGAGEDNDYVLQMLYLENALAGMFNLPCDLVVTAHPDSDKDDTTGRIFIGPLITGKAKIRIPLLFDEMYYAKSEATKDGVTYSLLTKLTGTFKASSRLSNRGQLEMYEEPNIKNILKKCGLPNVDKEIPWLIKGSKT